MGGFTLFVVGIAILFNESLNVWLFDENDTERLKQEILDRWYIYQLGDVITGIV